MFPPDGWRSIRPILKFRTGGKKRVFIELAEGRSQQNIMDKNHKAEPELDSGPQDLDNN